MKLCFGAARLALFMICAGVPMSVRAAPVEPVRSLAANEKAPLLDTLKDLVSIESGSEDREGLDKIAGLIADHLGMLGGQVELIDTHPAAPHRLVGTHK